MGCVHGAARRRAAGDTQPSHIGRRSLIRGISHMFCRYVGVSEPRERLQCFVGMLGCRSRESGSNGLYLEHVLGMGSVLTAVQKARQCSTKSRDNTNFFLFRNPRDHPTHPRVNFYGCPTSYRPGVGGRASRAFVGVSVHGKGLRAARPPPAG